ncbi:MAG: nitroreductase/quinone reductase family protein [Acidimicrobiia bacterium]|nr:nitroreductase/quinone reductase family protein [Acidimicrobiia bacterium]MDH5519182.1 nitroreductase/quinone reductase family protein [Acidimicrobiia bacterium]
MGKITGRPEIDAALARDLTIDITTIGRHSGDLRTVEIWFLAVDERIFITGTPGPRDWYANLLADDSLTFHLKESVRAELTATARPVDDEATRRHVFEHPSAHWYRSQTDIDELVANAPMVEVKFD